MKKYIKHLLVVGIMMLSVSVLFAQEKDVTKFLGIPVDGFKPEMIEKLKAKGYTYDKQNDILGGEFNGQKVNISVVTMNNKVYRIFIADQSYISETDIKIRFNRLCSQFVKNGKYISWGNYTIPEEEDISYEMAIHKKRYEASYSQTPATIDTLGIFANVYEKMQARYPGLTPDNATESIKKEIEEELSKSLFELLSKNSVWFMINEKYGKYNILMYYDNGYNMADGEDL